jgi:hypothetical protein
MALQQLHIRTTLSLYYSDAALIIHLPSHCSHRCHPRYRHVQDNPAILASLLLSSVTHDGKQKNELDCLDKATKVQVSVTCLLSWFDVNAPKGMVRRNYATVVFQQLHAGETIVLLFWRNYRYSTFSRARAGET